jgi:hypothetical protein
MLTHYLDNAVLEFRKLKALADKALAQVSDDDFFALLDEESNSIAIIVKHMGGNMHSRWSDFLTSDGEKSDRNRDSEFLVMENDTKSSILNRWEAGWHLLFDILGSLHEDDLSGSILIRSEPHTVMEAIQRQLAHYAYHIGQIVLLAKHFAGPEWQTLSVARGKSEEFTAETRKKWGA